MRMIFTKVATILRAAGEMTAFRVTLPSVNAQSF